MIKTLYIISLSIFCLHSGLGKKPNILYIMSDDHACNAISTYGGRLASIAPTPNIDRIAASGIRLDRCFVTNSICTPSRAVILSGQHSHKNGVKTLNDAFPGPESGTPNVANILQRSGYQTALIGKWHLRSAPWGFDYWKIGPGQGKYHDPFFMASTGTQPFKLSQPAFQPSECPVEASTRSGTGKLAELSGTGRNRPEPEGSSVGFRETGSPQSRVSLDYRP